MDRAPDSSCSFFRGLRCKKVKKKSTAWLILSDDPRILVCWSRLIFTLHGCKISWSKLTRHQNSISVRKESLPANIEQIWLHTCWKIKLECLPESWICVSFSAMAVNSFWMMLIAMLDFSDWKNTPRSSSESCKAQKIKIRLSEQAN